MISLKDYLTSKINLNIGGFQTSTSSILPVKSPIQPKQSLIEFLKPKTTISAGLKSMEFPLLEGKKLPQFPTTQLFIDKTLSFREATDAFQAVIENPNKFSTEFKEDVIESMMKTGFGLTGVSPIQQLKQQINRAVLKTFTRQDLIDITAGRQVVKEKLDLYKQIVQNSELKAELLKIVRNKKISLTQRVGQFIDDIFKQIEKTIPEKPKEKLALKEFLKPKKIPAKEEFKVGDVLNPQGKTNMKGEVTIREITGNTIKFIDSKGTEFAGIARSTVRNLINEGSWKKVTTEPITSMITTKLSDIKPTIKKTEKIIPFSRLTEVANKIKVKGATKQSLDEMRQLLAFSDEALKENPVRQLAKYANQNEEIPEVTGKGTSEFARRGDDIVTELGFEDSEQARRAYEQYLTDKKRVDEIRDSVRELRKNMVDIRKGEKLIKKVIAERRIQLRAAQHRFQLTDTEMAKIRKGRDIRAMTEQEFNDFMGELETRAVQIFERSEAMLQLKGTIWEKELRKWENLRQALKLPPISQMNKEQIEYFETVLNQYKIGDEFLSVRKLETVDRTDLKGIKTVREARERLAKEMEVEVEELENIKISEFDRFRYDTALAEKNNFYKLMVDTVNKNLLNAEARFLEIEKTTNDLIKKARKSRSRGLLERFIPQDKRIFKYLESPDTEKKTLEKVMTKEEIEVVNYIRDKYIEMRDYLVQMETLKKYRNDYITHIRRGFLEQWKETGLLNSFKTIFKQYKQDQVIFNILDSQTSEVLPLEKFFRFSMRRTGELEPTENVAKAFLAYVKSFEKKMALDAIVPKLDIYAFSLTPKKTTPRGLIFDRSLKRFLNEWMNTKKGRQTAFLGVQQGGKIDVMLRAGQMFTLMLDLGMNIPVGFAAKFGENLFNFIPLGFKNYALGLTRARTKQGKTLIERYKNFVGRTPFDEVWDASRDVGEKFTIAIMALFRDASIRANKTFLLGSLTKEEWQTGKLTLHRLAQIKRDMGRYRVIDGAKSVIGATTPGSVGVRYKSWAIPPVRTVSKNVRDLIQMLRAGDKNTFKSREFQELFRGIIAIASVMFIVRGVIGIDDKKDKSFGEQMLSKAYRDAMSLVGALDPETLFAVPRLLTFLEDFGKAIKDIERLERLLTPRAIKQFIPKETTIKTTGINLPKLPQLPKLPKLPSI